MAFMIFANGEIDQIVETLRIAKREYRDLVKMDCDDVRVYQFPTFGLAEDWQDNWNRRSWPHRNAAIRVGQSLL